MDKKRKNSKNKGSIFEREVAKALSKWTGHDFHRTPGSGALHWKNDARVVSDIVPPQDYPEWKVSVECKCYSKQTYSPDFQSVIDGTSTLWKHWEQCVNDANREQLVPMLITKITGLRKPWFCVIGEYQANKLGLHDRFPTGDFPRICVPHRHVVIFFLDHLFENFTAHEFLDRLFY